MSSGGVDGGECPSDGSGGGVEGGGKVNVVADGALQVEASGVALETLRDVDVEVAKAEVAEFKGG